MDRNGHFFEALPITPIEWWDDLLWLGGHHMGTVVDATEQKRTGEQGFVRTPPAEVSGGRQE